jgi:hypothetical protein
MNIDERLVALRRSLEQWSHMRMVARQEYEEQSRPIEAPADEDRLAQLRDTQNRLGRILEKHGQRLDDLERH